MKQSKYANRYKPMEDEDLNPQEKMPPLQIISFILTIVLFLLLITTFRICNGHIPVWVKWFNL